MLTVDGLVVRYPGFTLGPIDVQLGVGDFLTLIGPNGSGKTTLIRALLGLQLPDSGSSRLGRDRLTERDPSVLAHVGYVTDSSLDVLGEFTAEEYWQYCRAAHQTVNPTEQHDVMTDAREYAQLLDLPLTPKLLSSLSLGTRRKAQIVAALMHRPKLLVLDEVFSGLDFIATRSLEEILRELSRNGTTIISSNHDLDIASRLSTHVALLQEGQLILYRDIAEMGGPDRIEDVIVTTLREARRTKC